MPLNPVMQVQLYEFIPSVHAPPFWHGLGAQSSISKAWIYRNISVLKKVVDLSKAVFFPSSYQSALRKLELFFVLVK